MVHDEEARQLLAEVQARAPEAFHHQVCLTFLYPGNKLIFIQQRAGLHGMPGGNVHPQQPQHPGAAGYAGVTQDLTAQTAMMRELERKKRAMAPPVS